MAEPTVTHDEEHHRYTVLVDGEVAGLAVYHDRGGRRLFVHTEIADEHEGRGLGSVLVRGALEATDRDGLKAVPICPFVAGWLERHPEMQGVVDEDRRRLIESD
ncbi:GNAT family N-acetyltransferase [Euzebya rosea]|uniref:GNAT family N-acetyltransferase n=1 Tax=Euzebya rosea TaxID=2052804 RepID=UPI000D3E2B74|nr:GNAT family N-acetyltransferase [Euzebya rosea]